MESFLEFLKQNYVLLVNIGIFVIEFIILVIKRRPQTVDDFVAALHDVSLQVPSFINRVESPGHGEEKKFAVLAAAEHKVESVLHREITDREKGIAKKYFDEVIESVLSTPSKKGK